MYSISEFAGLLVKQAREEKQWDQQYLADALFSGQYPDDLRFSPLHPGLEGCQR